MENIEKTGNISEAEKAEIVKSVENAVRSAIEKLNDEEAGEYYYKLDDVEVVFKASPKVDIYVSVYYVTHFLEISESVAEALSELGEDLSDDEIINVFDEIYSEELREINNKYVIGMIAEIRIDLNDHYPGVGELVIKTFPVDCNRDYCDVGLWIALYLDDVDIEFVKENVALISSIIYDAVDRTVKLALI